MMIRLKRQASEAGGLVVPLLGNHEVKWIYRFKLKCKKVMNLQHDFRYVTKGDVESFGGWEKRNLAW